VKHIFFHKPNSFLPEQWQCMSLYQTSKNPLKLINRGAQASEKLKNFPEAWPQTQEERKEDVEGRGRE
jgi:hypothetical protein